MERIDPKIRNAVRALVIRDDQVLLLKKEGYESGGVRYALPGGGQDPGESLTAALQRECLEEIDCEVQPGELLSVHDFIKQRATEPVTWRHVVEFLFACELPAGYEPHNGPAPDKHQVDVVWMPIKQVSQLQLFPQYLSSFIPTLIPGNLPDNRPGNPLNSGPDLQQPDRYQGRFVDPGFGADS
ncbi:NUDIX domain-containing protein [Marinobacterium lutimaris]|uniref:ADP-ribose pyrophosphatase YjhB, NUDIX family n=1 Tax=Marinobacterium lutimaris TaxID=568106 RepID=A0A1H5X8N6_9GAMM|nr:NUDIX domain-containing protein [Marinobacterium lutimaris]SEG07616.1 ADP-ribose pyrophosphatase YjhB, NUDIX family [Marinobacterium lutimaris]